MGSTMIFDGVECRACWQAASCLVISSRLHSLHQSGQRLQTGMLACSASRLQPGGCATHTHTRTQGSDCGSLPGHVSIGDDCLFEIGSIVQTLFLSSVFKHITRQELQTCTELYLLGHDRKLPCRLRLAPQSCTAKPCTGLEQECTCRHSERIVITTFGKRTYTPRIAYFSTSISKLFTYPSEPQQLPAPLRSQRDPNPTSSPSMQTK